VANLFPSSECGLTGQTAHVLVVDDDPLIRRQLAELYSSHGFKVETAAGAEAALAALSARSYSLVLLDLLLPGRDGASLLHEIRERWPAIDVIMVTGHGSIRSAVEAMRQGAADYITKPFESEEILLATQRVLERRRLIDEIQFLRDRLADRSRFAGMVSRNPAMREVFALVSALANTDSTVVVIGESGTGKELVARALHFEGRRKEGPFVPINCAAIPETLLESELFGYDKGAFTGATAERIGKIELANGGTLFLDEVESIPLGMQAKLLRVLEERAIERLGSNRRIPVDMRVVAASNEDLAQAVADGRMRQDFYYRIHVVPIHLPPLRERREDIPLLVSEFLQNHPLAREKAVTSISETAMQQLLQHDWPGNVRELWNVLERAVLTAGRGKIERVGVGNRPAGAAQQSLGGTPSELPLREHLRQAERQYLEALLDRFQGNVVQTARFAGVDQATLHRKLRAHGIDAGRFRLRRDEAKKAAKGQSLT